MDGQQTVEQALIATLETKDVVDSKTFADANNFSHDQVVGIAMSQTAQERLQMGTAVSSKSWVMTEEGKNAFKFGSPEMILFNNLSEQVTVEKSTLLKLFKDPEELELAMNIASKQRMILVEKSGTKEEPIYNLKRVAGTFADDAKKLDGFEKLGEQDPIMKMLVKRKWVKSVIIKSFPISKGPKFSEGGSGLCFPELTTELLETGEWENKSFKPINYQAMGLKNHGGFLHPLLKVRNAFRQIFLELGYEEMPTNRWVESSFWNFDSLFQPQQHPARDAHDTFFVANPAKSTALPLDYLERVKQMHEVGGHGSIGWRYKFSDEEPWKNILRTHTTAISSQMLYALSQKPFKPMKYFSIDRVFRNETIDATHLAEFHQIEGFVADYNISLISLMGAIKEFYARIGIQELKFKPAYNPYTEPSMEIFGYHEGKKDWIEIGNSGVFRPEMLLPMGLPEGVGVAAWGLSLERPTMIMFGYQKITQLVGAKVDLKMIYSNPLVHFSNK